MSKMRFIKRYKHKYTIKADDGHWYLCYKGQKVRLYPDSENIGYNLTQAEKTLDYSLNKKYKHDK